MCVKNRLNELEGRMTNLAILVVRMLKTFKYSPLNIPIINQIIRSSSSIGANYREANVAESLKAKRYILKISRKEAKETAHWLILLKETNPEHINKIQKIEDELTQLSKILTTIIKKLS